MRGKCEENEIIDRKEEELPAGKAQLPQLKIDRVALVPSCGLAVREEEVRLCAARQHNGPSFDCWPCGDLALWLKGLGWHVAFHLGSR